MSFAETFKALSDPVRREILMLLRRGLSLRGRDRDAFRYERCDNFLSLEYSQKGRSDMGEPT